MADDRQNRSAPRRLHVVCQVAGPLICQLLEDLAGQGVQSELLTGWADVPAGTAPGFHTVPATRLAKAPAWKRLATWSLFTLQATWRMARCRRWPTLVVTNPPWPMLAAPLLRPLGLRYVLLVYDIYPDVAERLGALRPGGLAARLWRRLSRRAMLGAEAVITLSDRMARTLRGHLRTRDRVDIEVIPNWADTSFIRPMARDANPFAVRYGLRDKMVVTYSGAFGATHDTDSIVAAAEMLADCPDVHFMLIGGGTRWSHVQALVAEKRLANLTLLPLQPWEVLPQSLAAADCAIVCLDEGYEGISVPSKTYYALAAGAALLAVSSDGSDLQEMVDRYGCGTHVPPRSPDRLARAIRDYRADPSLLARHRSAARRAAEEEFSRSRATARYLALLASRFSW